mmetsp:Transcript_14576/g.25808  ORF Transcript_14576/g.25808 Transcript_14576/m.25808 type:complete len:218 (+) Transcript_14576:41-694(+)
MAARTGDGRAIRSAGSAVLAGTPRLTTENFYKAATGANPSLNATVTSQFREQLSCADSRKAAQSPRADSSQRAASGLQQQKREDLLAKLRGDGHPEAQDMASLASSMVLKEPSRPETPEHLRNEKAGEEFMNRLRRDNVSFLIGRVLPTSRGSHQELKRLKEMTPRTIETAQSATKMVHSAGQLEGAAPPERRYARQRDRSVEFTEALIRQAHVIRK